MNLDGCFGAPGTSCKGRGHHGSQPHVEGDCMIACDACQTWYHRDCEGISSHRWRNLQDYDTTYTCNSCRPLGSCPLCPLLNPALAPPARCIYRHPKAPAASYDYLSEVFKHQVQKLQNFAAKVAAGGYKRRDRATPVIQELKWIKMKEKVKFDQCMMVYKVTPKYYP
ncbi:hypothetical protein GWK47_038708 [Chionoecetes opilio]|uniref:PHD-type domain-containing protein n=1 Tax=Chionoecetes opilio TaxID=41210 RepID=A0A8J4YDN2_CHIOP|nr:hypothetical protein GWK47_038708 [Chionoecetes opilio]